MYLFWFCFLLLRRNWGLNWTCCLCLHNFSFFIWFLWARWNYRQISKNRKEAGNFITLKWNIMITVSIFLRNKCMQRPGKCQYLCQTCLLLLSRSSTAGEVRRQGLCKLIICHGLLSKELQTKLWPWESSNITTGQTQFTAWVCPTITHTVTSLAQVPDTTKNKGACPHWLIHVSDKPLFLACQTSQPAKLIWLTEISGQV